MKDVNKIAQINIYIASKVLRNKKEKGMEEDLKKINDMFEKEDFSGLDEIYKKYFIPSEDTSKKEKE
jgi:hypothetical protein